MCDRRFRFLPGMIFEIVWMTAFGRLRHPHRFLAWNVFFSTNFPRQHRIHEDRAPPGTNCLRVCVYIVCCFGRGVCVFEGTTRDNNLRVSEVERKKSRSWLQQQRTSPPKNGSYTDCTSSNGQRVDVPVLPSVCGTACSLLRDSFPCLPHSTLVFEISIWTVPKRLVDLRFGFLLFLREPSVTRSLYEFLASFGVSDCNWFETRPGVVFSNCFRRILRKNLWDTHETVPIATPHTVTAVVDASKQRVQKTRVTHVKVFALEC